jgi:hypothetical protein
MLPTSGTTSSRAVRSRSPLLSSSNWMSSISSHSAVSPFKWSQSITIISLCRRAAIRTGRLLSTCSIGIWAGPAGLRWHSFLWFIALLMHAWYMPHTEQQRLARCGWTDGQYKSYGGMMNPSIFSFWTMLLSWRFTNSDKKVGASALDVTIPWPLCFAETGLGRKRHGSRFWSGLLQGVQHCRSLQRTNCNSTVTHEHVGLLSSTAVMLLRAKWHAVLVLVAGGQ